MIIDIHTHTFPEKIAARALTKLSLAAHCVPYTEATDASLLSSMECAGVDVSVICPVATSPAQVSKVNDGVLIKNEAFTGRGLLSFGCIHPDLADYADELVRLQKAGVKGIKLHPVYQGTDIDDIRFLRILYKAAELGLIVLTHGGQDIGFPGVVHCSPRMMAHALREIGPMHFIAAHMGGWHDWQEVPDCLAGTGCYLDTSFSTDSFEPLPDGYWKKGENLMLDEPSFTNLVHAIGADHILYGSDSPWSKQTDSIAFIRNTSLTETEKAAILRGNASKLLNLI